MISSLEHTVKAQKETCKSLLRDSNLGVDTCTPSNMVTINEEIIGLKEIHKTFDVGFDDLLMVSFER